MKTFSFLNVIMLTALLAACSVKVPDENVTDSDDVPALTPDYTGIVMPPNIAPMNFEIDIPGERYVTKVEGNAGTPLVVEGKMVKFDMNDWHRLLEANKGDDLRYSVYVSDSDGRWTRYGFINHVADDSIDRYFSYRLIEPSYVQYGALSINQRDLSSFDESVIFNNAFPCEESRGFCINCHVPRNQNADGMSQFHVRQFNGGTVIINGDKAEKVNLKTDSTLSAGVYPAWHPTLNLIAYSVNETHQRFFTGDNQKVEVIDGSSGLILYDVDRGTVSTIVDSPDVMETFPAWSSDGTKLYYSAARYPAGVTSDNVDASFDSLHYDILVMDFNPADRSFSAPDTVVAASSREKSALLPRISPDGKWLLFCEADYGTFHIWHKDSDLYVVNLSSGEIIPLSGANSDDTDSYHSWSSGSRWIIFSSRRDDGSYTRPYITYFSPEGTASKAFVVPQEDTSYYKNLMKSYNVPEFMVQPVKVPRRELVRTVGAEAVRAVYE
ncbi:MAG: hypothetical protein K2G49_05700 [Muribaculum sp.]|nr:hypothetical protein [Muribaculum sp.]